MYPPPLFFAVLYVKIVFSMLQPASTLPSEGVTIYFLTPRAYKKAKNRGGGQIKSVFKDLKTAIGY